MKISSDLFLPALFFLGLMHAPRLKALASDHCATLERFAKENFEGGVQQLAISNSAPKGNASQEVLLLRGWVNSWPLRSIVSQTVSVSSCLLSSSVPLKVSSCMIFPCNFGTRMQKATQLVVQVASLTQDIAAV